MPESQNSSSPDQQRCPRCGSSFTCGLQARQATCWCFEMPRVISATDANREGCLCANCLKTRIEEIQRSK